MGKLDDLIAKCEGTPNRIKALQKQIDKDKEELKIAKAKAVKVAEDGNNSEYARLKKLTEDLTWDIEICEERIKAESKPVTVAEFKEAWEEYLEPFDKDFSKKISEWEKAVRGLAGIVAGLDLASSQIEQKKSKCFELVKKYAKDHGGKSVTPGFYFRGTSFKRSDLIPDVQYLNAKKQWLQRR